MEGGEDGEEMFDALIGGESADEEEETGLLEVVAAIAEAVWGDAVFNEFDVLADLLEELVVAFAAGDDEIDVALDDALEVGEIEFLDGGEAGGVEDAAVGGDDDGSAVKPLGGDGVVEERADAVDVDDVGLAEVLDGEEGWLVVSEVEEGDAFDGQAVDGGEGGKDFVSFLDAVEAQDAGVDVGGAGLLGEFEDEFFNAAGARPEIRADVEDFDGLVILHESLNKRRRRHPLF